MKWEDLRRSDNVEDQRGLSGQTVLAGGGGIVTLIAVVVYMLLGGNPQQLLQQLPQGGGAGQQQSAQLSDDDKKMGDFVSAVLGDTEDVWTKLFEQQGQHYVDPKLVLFTDQVQSGCGFASSATGPFYCPEDQKVYIDLSFYKGLKERFHAPGEFAEAYVIAHEVGHHVQDLQGISARVSQLQSQTDKRHANDLSVRLELQADFYAGIWAHYAQKFQNIIEPGDIDQALNAASQIGDDKIQMQAQGRVVPDSFTHGTGAQRVKWFKLGYDSGDISKGDTFNARDL